MFLRVFLARMNLVDFASIIRLKKRLNFENSHEFVQLFLFSFSAKVFILKML